MKSRHVQRNREMNRYKRKPEHDKRIRRGDDFAGDAWLDTETGNIVYGVVGYDYTKIEDDEAERAMADYEHRTMRGY